MEGKCYHSQCLYSHIQIEEERVFMEQALSIQKITGANVVCS